MCANIKGLLCDIEDSFNVGYLCQYSNTGIELLNTTGQNSGNPHSYMCVSMHACDLLFSYSDWPE